MDLSLYPRLVDMAARFRRVYYRAMEPVLRKWDLSQGEMDVLMFLHNNPQRDRATDIVTYRGLSKAHVSALTASLEKRGLLERCFDPADRRSAHLSPTPAAEPIVQDGAQVQQELLSRQFRGIPPEAQALLEDTLEKISENLTAISKDNE